MGSFLMTVGFVAISDIPLSPPGASPVVRKPLGVAIHLGPCNEFWNGNGRCTRQPAAVALGGVAFPYGRPVRWSP